MSKIDNKNIRSQFPYLNNSNDIIYFDNAATTHKPDCVISSLSNFYTNQNSNIHRSLHNLSAGATDEYEQVRNKIKKFICAPDSKEIIFTSGTTESINLVAQSYLKYSINSGDIIFISPIEHHANIVPWQVLAKQTGAILKFLPINENLEIDIEKVKALFNDSVKFIASHHVSNVTGVIQDVKALVREAKKFNIPILIDGAQAVAHMPIDVVDLGCDFYCFSGHKLFAPTGTGVLFGKGRLLEEFIPSKYGGGMVSSVTLSDSAWGGVPHRLEAGTPNIAGVIGLGSAIDFIVDSDLRNISYIELELSNYMNSRLKEIPNLVRYGPPVNGAPIFSFNIKGLHHYDLASLLGESGVFIRSGHLCNQTLMGHLGIGGCVRASLCFYNNSSEIDRFIIVLKKIISLLQK